MQKTALCIILIHRAVKSLDLTLPPNLAALVHTSSRQHRRALKEQILRGLDNVSTKLNGNYINSIIAISAASPRRGPVLVIRQ